MPLDNRSEHLEYVEFEWLDAELNCLQVIFAAANVR